MYHPDHLAATLGNSGWGDGEGSPSVWAMGTQQRITCLTGLPSSVGDFGIWTLLRNMAKYGVSLSPWLLLPPLQQDKVGGALSNSQCKHSGHCRLCCVTPWSHSYRGCRGIAVSSSVWKLISQYLDHNCMQDPESGTGQGLIFPESSWTGWYLSKVLRNS